MRKKRSVSLVYADPAIHEYRPGRKSAVNPAAETFPRRDEFLKSAAVPFGNPRGQRQNPALSTERHRAIGPSGPPLQGRIVSLEATERRFPALFIGGGAPVISRTGKSHSGAESSPLQT